MRYLKMLGLAAISAAALMAFGVGSASATTLYSTGVPISAGTTLHMTLESGSITTSTTDGKILVDTCTATTVDGKTTNTSGTTVTMEIESLKLEGCTVKTLNLLPGTLHIDSAGTMTGSGQLITVNFGGVSCRYGYGSSTHLGIVNTGTIATNTVINEQEPKSFICPDTTKWVASYFVTTPHDVTAGA
jgi:hypothetical protein